MIKGKKYISIGKKVTFFNGARIEAVSKKGNQLFTPKLIVGNNTSFEQNLHLTFAGNLSIGNNCVITGNVMISDIVHSYDTVDRNILLNDIVVKPVKIGDNCFVGYGAQILPGVSLGNNCIIGAGSIVTKSFDSYSMIVGNPAKLIMKYDINKKKWIKV